jgi:hypothetical protein
MLNFGVWRSSQILLENKQRGAPKGLSARSLWGQTDLIASSKRIKEETPAILNEHHYMSVLSPWELSEAAKVPW